MTDIRKATTAQITGPRIPGQLGEIIIDTDKKTIVVEDGSGAGVPLARQDLVHVNLSGRSLNYLTEQTPTWTDITVDTAIRFHDTDIEISGTGELVLRIDELYLDITVPFSVLQGVAERAANNTEITSANSVKIFDFGNIVAYAGLTADAPNGNKLLLHVRNESGVPGQDITAVPGYVSIYFREIRFTGTPQIEPASYTGDVTYYDGNRWIPAEPSFEISEIQIGNWSAVTESMPSAGDQHTKLRSNLNENVLDIGSSGDGELRFQFPGGNMHSVSYSKLRTLTKAATDTLADVTGNTPNAYQVTETNIKNAPANKNGSIVISFGILENTNRVMVAVKRTTPDGTGTEDNTSLLKFFKYEVKYTPRTV